MSVVVKYPSHAAHYPDERFCGQCGRYGQPLINDNNGFGPCVDGARSPIECRSLQSAIVEGHLFARAADKPLHEDTSGLIKRLGIPQSIIDVWVAKAERVSAIRHEVRQARYGDGLSFIEACKEWIGKGDSDERILILIEELRIALDPTDGRIGEVTMGKIMEWHARLANRAADILVDTGDWDSSI